eukprot:10732970-Prorocentrum_lima.AAC.1
MTSSLVGSEMCIRDSPAPEAAHGPGIAALQRFQNLVQEYNRQLADLYSCLLYTSDAADDM